MSSSDLRHRDFRVGGIEFDGLDWNPRMTESILSLADNGGSSTRFCDHEAWPEAGYTMPVGLPLWSRVLWFKSLGAGKLTRTPVPVMSLISQCGIFPQIAEPVYPLIFARTDFETVLTGPGIPPGADFIADISVIRQ